MKRFIALTFFAAGLLLAAPAMAGGYLSDFSGGSSQARGNYLSDYSTGSSSGVSRGRYLSDFGGHGQGVVGRRGPSKYYSTSQAGRIDRTHGRIAERQWRERQRAQTRVQRTSQPRRGSFFSRSQRVPQLYRQGPSGNYARRNSVGAPSPVAAAVVLGLNPGTVVQNY